MRDGCRTVPRDRFLPELLPGRTYSLGSYDARLARPCRGTRGVAGPRLSGRPGSPDFQVFGSALLPAPTPATPAPTCLRASPAAPKGVRIGITAHTPYPLDPISTTSTCIPR